MATMAFDRQRELTKLLRSKVIPIGLIKQVRLGSTTVIILRQTILTAKTVIVVIIKEVNVTARMIVTVIGNIKQIF